MVRVLWRLVGGVFVASCAAQTPQPERLSLPQNANVQPSTAQSAAPLPTASAVDEDEVARQRAYARAAEIYERQLQLSARAQQRERDNSERTPEEWLRLAREVCRPNRCDGGPIDVNCYGGNPPEWARSQAGTEQCAKRDRQLEEERPK